MDSIPFYSIYSTQRRVVGYALYPTSPAYVLYNTAIWVLPDVNRRFVETSSVFTPGTYWRRGSNVALDYVTFVCHTHCKAITSTRKHKRLLLYVFRRPQYPFWLVEYSEKYGHGR